MGLKKGDTVLTPVFDCDSTLIPFRVLELKIEFYKSDPFTLEADIDDIKKRVTNNVKLIHIINHFGLPQPWDSLMDLRKKTKIPILEDNAFSLFSKYKGESFGSFGDVSIFSLYKVLSLVDGGMLRINNPKYSFSLPKRVSKWYYPPERIKILKLIISMVGYNYLPDILKNFISPPKRPLPPLFSDKPGYPDWHMRDKILYEFSYDYFRPISKISQHQLKKFNVAVFDKIKIKTRFYYKFIVQSLKDIAGVTVLWQEIPGDVVPGCVTVLIDSHRDEILFNLRTKRFGVIAWPTFSGDIIENINEYPEIEIIGRKILQLMISSQKVLETNADPYFKSLVDEFKKCIDEYDKK
tara:strand:- start:7105 stop:8160 length:1056 start_codon:yes stop_codon:yes gene_type:complete